MRARKEDATELEAEFRVFYEQYPKRVARADALKAYAAARKKAEAATILAGLKTSAQLHGREKRYIPAAGTWLRGEGWADEPYMPLADSEPVTFYGEAPC